MEFPILVRWHLYIESGPCVWSVDRPSQQWSWSWGSSNIMSALVKTRQWYLPLNCIKVCNDHAGTHLLLWDVFLSIGFLSASLYYFLISLGLFPWIIYAIIIHIADGKFCIFLINRSIRCTLLKNKCIFLSYALTIKNLKLWLVSWLHLWYHRYEMILITFSFPSQFHSPNLRLFSLHVIFSSVLILPCQNNCLENLHNYITMFNMIKRQNLRTLIDMITNITVLQQFVFDNAIKHSIKSKLCLV